MAQTDLRGMLTEGLFEPAQQPTPRSYRESILGAAQQAGTGLRRGLGAVTGTDTRTTAEALQAQLRGLNPENIDDQQQIVRLVSKVDPAATVEDIFKVTGPKGFEIVTVGPGPPPEVVLLIPNPIISPGVMSVFRIVTVLVIASVPGTGISLLFVSLSYELNSEFIL